MNIFLLNFTKIFGQFKKKQYLCMLILDKSVALWIKNHILSPLMRLS